MSSLGAFFGKRSSLLFWQKGNFIFVEKRNATFTNIQKTSYLHVFFSPVKKYSIFGKKKCHLSSWYKKDHIPVQFFWKDHLFRTFEENIIFPCIFWERSSFIFRPKYKVIFSGKRNIIFPDNKRRKIIYQYYFFVVEKTIFSEHLKKISYFHVFFWEGSSFMFRLKNKMIFSGKRNITFPGNIRKIIFQRDFFGKTIFSDHLEKENMVSRAVRLVKVAQ